MKKTAQQPTIDFKRDEINRAVNDALTNLNTKMQAATQQLNDQVTRELKNIINNLQKEVATKVNEIKSLVPTTQTQTAKDQLSGGKGDDLDPKDVNKDELKRGIEVETEHTKNRDLAKEIALDHLAEDPKYYTHLEKVHKESGATPAFWRRNYDYLESPYMNTELIEKNTKNAEFLRDLVKLADKLDASGLRKEADRIDRIIRIAVEEWEYHGYGSPEEYERVRRMRRPELYEVPKEEEKIEIGPEKTEYVVEKDLVVPDVIGLLLWNYGHYGHEWAERNGDDYNVIGKTQTILLTKDNVIYWNSLSDNQQNTIRHAISWFEYGEENTKLNREEIRAINKFIMSLEDIGVKI